MAGAFVGDAAGTAFDLDAYRRAIDAVREFGGTPVIFQSFGLTALPASGCSTPTARSAGTARGSSASSWARMFAPFGHIYDLDTYAGLLAIPECVGAKHSSLDRELEWQRLAAARRAAAGLHGAHRATTWPSTW